MNAVEKGEIYDRLLKMKLETEFEKIPNPDYINKKLVKWADLWLLASHFKINVAKLPTIPVAISDGDLCLVERSLNGFIRQHERLK